MIQFDQDFSTGLKSPTRIYMSWIKKLVDFSRLQTEDRDLLFAHRSNLSEKAEKWTIFSAIDSM